MTSENRESRAPIVIEASTFQVGGGMPAQRAGGARVRTAILLAASGVLGLMVVVVIFVLPQWVENAPKTPPDASVGATQVSADEAIPPEAPTADSATREDTQAQLRTTLDKLAMLEAIEGDKWAKSDLFEIREQIAEGEKAYREKRYVTAQNIYLDTSTAVEKLLAEVPNVVESLLDSGNLALDQSDSARAMQAFTQVLTMDPTNARAIRGTERAKTLDQVVALVGQAEGYERLAQTDKALAIYREALAIDKDIPVAVAAIERITRGKQAGQFSAAMSDGLNALKENRFADARQAFKRAAKIEPSRPEAAESLRQVDNTEASYHIDIHLDKANKAVAAERWDEAVGQFSAALKYDERLSPALAGKHSADIRRRLDKHLSDFLAQPERLATNSVHAEASQLLAQARKLGASGARITAQIAALARELELAQTPINVSLVSDGATEVTLFRVSELGRFTSRELTLLPGAYTAVGKRDGYRDVRVEFTLKHGGAASPITIRCEEKFAFGN